MFQTGTKTFGVTVIFNFQNIKVDPQKCLINSFILEDFNLSYTVVQLCSKPTKDQIGKT